ncbi:MAG: exosome complex protein Rrp42 [Candidatus Thermoplasmatota archaeon]
MNEEIVLGIRKDYIYQLADVNKRIDGRKFDEIREISFEVGKIKTAEGSARVKMGETDVLVGVKIEPGEPYPDAPNMGVLTTNAELVPMASPTFESGPPTPDAIELARVVDRGIRESDAIDLASLCIKEGEKVWVVFVDIHVLDYGGNLFDPSALGALLALENTIVPAKRFGLGEDFKLPIRHYPVTSTAVKIGKTMFIDPNLEEENVATARLTVTTDENGDIRAMQKGLAGSIASEDIKMIFDIAIKNSDLIRKKLGLGGKIG